MRAAAIIALCAAAFAATPASACFLEAPCSVDVFVPPYDADLPPPQIFEMVKRRHDGGLSLAGFYNEPFAAPVIGADEVSPGYAGPGYAAPGFASPGVIYSPWGRTRRHIAYERRHFHMARFHAHTRQF